jgi:hypothetical protein
MKNKLRQLLLAGIFVCILPVSISIAQEPPHPPTIGHGNKGNAPAGNARIGDGASILVAFALAYAYQKYSRRKKKNKIVDVME